MFKKLSFEEVLARNAEEGKIKEIRALRAKLSAEREELMTKLKDLEPRYRVAVHQARIAEGAMKTDRAARAAKQAKAVSEGDYGIRVWATPTVPLEPGEF